MCESLVTPQKNWKTTKIKKRGGKLPSLLMNKCIFIYFLIISWYFDNRFSWLELLLLLIYVRHFFKSSESFVTFHILCAQREGLGSVSRVSLFLFHFLMPNFGLHVIFTKGHGALFYLSLFILGDISLSCSCKRMISPSGMIAIIFECLVLPNWNPAKIVLATT